MKVYLLLFLEVTILCLSTSKDLKAKARRYHVLNSYALSNITSISASEEADSVYIASVNRIDRLDKNLKRLDEAITGPQNDSADCTAPWCGVEGERVDNINKLLLVDHVKSRIIVCGSLYQGSCETREWKTLEKIYNSKDRFLEENKPALRKMVCVSPDCNAVGLIGQGFTVGSPVLYIANSQDDVNAPHTTISALGIYSLNHSGKNENSLFGQTIDGNSVMDDINQNKPIFQYIFETGDFDTGHIYFLFNSQQVPYVKGYVNKIARICKRDSSFFSYVEMPLACDPDNPDVTIGERIITNAYFAHRGVHNGTLYVTYNFLKKEYSTACDYDIKVLDRLFEETLESCWTCGGYLNCGSEKIVELVEGECQISRYLTDDANVTQELLNENYLSFFPSFVPTTSVWCGTAYAASKIKRTKIIDGNIIYQEQNSNFSNIIVDDNQKVAFIGSLEGQLLKINLKEINKENRKYATVDIGEPLIGNLVWGIQDASHPPRFYAQTAKEVLHMTTAACKMYKDCQSCFASSDVYCGWCTLKNKCLAREECLSDAETEMARRWLKPGKDTCIRNQNKLVFQRSHNGPIDILISNLPQLNEGESYLCVYEGVGNISKPATTDVIDANSTRLTCDVPSPTQIPMSSDGSDFVEVPLKILYNNNVDILTKSVTFYDCEQYATRTDRPCYDCLKSKWNCSWSVAQHRCVSPSSIDNGTRDTWIEHDQTDECPHVQDTFHPHPLIPVRYPTNIILKVVNMPPMADSRNGINCNFELDKGHTFNSRGTIQPGAAGESTSTVLCSKTSFGYDAKKTLLQSKLTLTWDTDKTVDFKENEFTFYKCSATRDDCSKCLSADAQYRCGWCQNPGGNNGGQCQIPELCNNRTFISESRKCPVHEITSFTPSSGPIEGGTEVEIFGKNMGATSSEVSEIEVADTKCTLIPEKFVTSTKIVCRTGKVVKETQGLVSVQVRNIKQTSKNMYKYKKPDVTTVEPLLGPQAGGTKLTVRGSNFNIGGSKRITIDHGFGAGVDCNDLSVVNDSMITCLTAEVTNAKDDLQLSLVIDGNYYLIPKLFSYKPNPQVKEVKTLSNSGHLTSYVGGGRKLFIYGSSFKSVQKSTLTVTVFGLDRTTRRKRRLARRNKNRKKSNKKRRRSVEDVFVGTPTNFTVNCKVENDTMLICETPQVKRNVSATNGTAGEPLKALLTLKMDSEEIKLGNLTYLDNPDFSAAEPDRQQVEQGYLKIDADNLAYSKAVTQDEIVVLIGEQRCFVETIKENQFLCVIPKKPEGDQLKYDLKISIGTTTWKLEPVLYRPPNIDENGTITKVIVIVVVLVVVLLVVFGIIWRKRQKRYKANKDDFKNAIENLEQSVRADFRKAFAELSIEMSDLTADVIDTGIPCLDYRTYVTNLFFPSVRDHICMRRPSEQPEADSDGSKAHKQFLDLLMNPTFLFVFVRTLEEQRQSFTNRDKAHVASLLTVALHHDLKYFTQTVKELVKNLIERNLEKNPKLIFRRNDSIADRCLSNWLYITLYPYLRKNVGKMIFMLLKAIKQQVSKGPLDAVSGKARYTLSDDRLLKEDIQYHNLTLFVKTQEEGDDDEPSIVKVLTCDSVAQVKEKVMDVIYKRLPFSQRPRADQLDLEWHHGRSGQLVLPIDNTISETNSRWSRLYTISDYKVDNNATLALKQREQEHQSSSDIQDTSAAPSVHSADTSALTPMLPEENSTRLYHLVKSTDETEQNRQSSINRDRHKYIPDLYLLRLLNMKGILQNYVHAVINSIFDETSIPLPVKYLFSFLDEIAAKHEITDPNILHLWKTNSLPCRFWVTILKNPEFVFDIEKPDTIGSSMTVITQTFIDACAVVEQRPTKDSPINKQLYAKEIPTYMRMVQDYYKKIKEDPAVHEMEMNSFLDNIQQEAACDFDVNTALQELWPWVNKYYDEIMEKMDDDDPYTSYQMSDAKQLLMQTYNLMEHGSNTESS